jgi:hypothetical protein
MVKIGNSDSTTEATNFLTIKLDSHTLMIMSTASQVNQATPRMSKMPLYLNSMQQIIPPEARLLTTAEHPNLQRQSLKSKHSQ